MDKLLKAQQEIGAIKRDSSNPFFKSKYFDINAILSEVKPILNKHGLIISQPLDIIEGKNGLRTAIIDVESGKVVIQGSCFLPEGLDPQKTGSAITYFRRYALQSLLALEAEDDDGNVASGNVAKKESKNVEEFMQDLEPTPEEITLWENKLMTAVTLKDLQSFWKVVPPMVKDKLIGLKDSLKVKLGGK